MSFIIYFGGALQKTALGKIRNLKLNFNLSGRKKPLNFELLKNDDGLGFHV